MLRCLQSIRSFPTGHDMFACKGKRGGHVAAVWVLGIVGAIVLVVVIAWAASEDTVSISDDEQW